MLVVNFSHPLAAHQRDQLEACCGRPVDRVVDVQVHFNPEEPFGAQAAAAVDAAGLTSGDWQTLPLVVVPPSFAPVACACLAELHGRIGHFPAVVRLRPRRDATPPAFDVAEVINLQHLREAARGRR